MMAPIHIVVWEYTDKSGWGIVRAFASEHRANDMLALMKEHSSDRLFYLRSVQIEEEEY